MYGSMVLHASDWLVFRDDGMVSRYSNEAFQKKFFPAVDI